MKVNAKVGGVNTCWSVLGTELLRKYFNKEVRVGLPVCCFALGIRFVVFEPGVQGDPGVW